jgi:hypothetical protein
MNIILQLCLALFFLSNTIIKMFEFYESKKFKVRRFLIVAKTQVPFSLVGCTSTIIKKSLAK